ncbi:MAG: glutamate formimidoyltransferase [Cryomorphaceae bacterium]|nr:MAG: glutamate formimidoyltransferase [Cryomorphaceae bacterium]
MEKRLLECVPNISEGRDAQKIKAVTDVIETVEGVQLLDVDPGASTNRTVITFVGEPEAVIEAAFRVIKKASEVIDMSKHKGEHPRFGATDVCPLIPISGITMEETAELAHKLGERVGKELGIPGYYYENAATQPKRKNLAYCRQGEYEGLDKLSQPEWKPDFGPAAFNASVKKTGAVAISARDFLVAYNINLNTTSTRRANAIAFDIREAGRIKREGDPLTGKVVTDENGEPVREPGKLKAVKGIGWYIDEYGIAQLSLNLTNISITSVHEAFEAACESAQERGIRVTGSEIVGLIPLKAMLDAADYFLKKQERSLGIDEKEKIKIAVKSLGLDDLAPFHPGEKIIEYVIARNEPQRPLVNMTLTGFANETASESMAPGGGSVAAYVGAIGVALGTMVANLSSHKRGWDEKWEQFSEWAEKGQCFKDELLYLVDEDTNSFNGIMEAFRMPKDSEEEKKARLEAIDKATRYAIEIPFRVMKVAFASMEVMEEMAKNGNPNSVTDAAVGALCARTAVMGAWLNVKVNTLDYNDKAFVDQTLNEAESLVQKAQELEKAIIDIAHSKL